MNIIIDQVCPSLFIGRRKLNIAFPRQQNVENNVRNHRAQFNACVLSCFSKQEWRPGGIPTAFLRRKRSDRKSRRGRPGSVLLVPCSANSHPIFSTADRLRRLTEGFNFFDCIADTEACPYCSRKRPSIARENPLLHFLRPCIIHVHEAFHIGMSTRTAVARSDAPQWNFFINPNHMGGFKFGTFMRQSFVAERVILNDFFEDTNYWHRCATDWHDIAEQRVDPRSSVSWYR